MSAVKLFESKKIRSVWDAEKGKWYFSIVDVRGFAKRSKSFIASVQTVVAVSCILIICKGLESKRG